MIVRFWRDLLGAILLVVLVFCGLQTIALAVTVTSSRDIMTRQQISTASNHEISFITPTGVDSLTDSIILTFAPGFSLSDIDASDILLSHGATTGFETSETVGSSAAVGVWGATISGQVVTLTAPTDAALGEVASGQRIVIRIGTAAGVLASRIVNPSVAGTYGLHLTGAFGDAGDLIIPIASNDSLSVSATVPDTTPPAVTPPPDAGGGGSTAGSGPSAPPASPPPVSEPVPPPTEPPVITPPPVVTPPTSPSPGDTPPGGTGTGESGTGSGSGSGTGDPGGTGSGGGSTTFLFRYARIISADEHSILLSWETDRSTSGLIEYGIGDYRERLVDTTVSVAHLERISGLLPDTDYQLRISARAATFGGVISTTLTARTALDVTAPANPSALEAVGQDRQVALNWVNPADTDFLEVVLVAREERFATSISDGRVVYAGNAQGVIDTGLLPGQLYFYTLFARDRSGNVSSGAIVSTQTWSTVPDPIQSGTSTVVVPSVIDTPSAVTRTVKPRWSEVSGSIPFNAVNGVFEAFSLQVLRVEVPNRIEGQMVDRVEMQVGEDRYQFVELSSGVWIATAVLPAQGQVEVRVQAALHDGSKAGTSAVFVSKPRAMVQDELSHQAATGTEVRVMRSGKNGYELWDAKSSNQVNPTVIGEDGLYGFFVEPGTYQLFVRREGYLSFDQEVVVRGNILSVPLTVRVGTPVEQVLANAREVLQSPVVQAVNTQVVAPVVVAVAVTNLATAASAASVFRYLYFLFTQPLLLFRRKKRKQWGVVYDALSKKPLDLAIVRLLDASTGRVVQTRITDIQGRYSFFVKPGTYRLQVVKQGFQFPSVYLAKDQEDGAWLDLYHGELVTVKEGGALIAANVPVDPPEVKEKTPKKLLAERRYRLLQRVGAATGVIVSIGSFALSPGWLTGGLFVLQAATYALFYRLAAPAKPKDWGIVYDGSSKRGLGQTVVRIFDKRFHKLLETQITDKEGKYAFFAGPNVYNLIADKTGYEAYHSADIDLTQSKNPVVSEKITLKPK